MISQDFLSNCLCLSLEIVWWAKLKLHQISQNTNINYVYIILRFVLLQYMISVFNYNIV
jgi:hypothetical protein